MEAGDLEGVRDYRCWSPSTATTDLGRSRPRREAVLPIASPLQIWLDLHVFVIAALDFVMRLT
jgi:hypothetical protein